MNFVFPILNKTGDFDLSARIESLTAPNLYTKAGLMAREELSDNSRSYLLSGIPE